MAAYAVLSVAVWCGYRIDSAHFEPGGESNDSIALREHGCPPNNGDVVSRVLDAVDLTGRLGERTTRRELLRFAGAWTDQMLLRYAAVREDHIAQGFVIMPRNGIAGLHREGMDLNCGGHRVTGAGGAKVVLWNGSKE